MSPDRPSPSGRPAAAVMALTLFLFLGGACSGRSQPPSGAPGGRGGGPPPAAGVSIVSLQLKPVEDASEFIATVRSLHSTTIQPQVEGKVTRIFVKSGDRVKPGAPLVLIDPEKQTATVHSTESTRQAREADVTYWRSQVDRLRSLLDAGAISRNEFDTAQHELETAQAALASLNAQVREGQVQLQYYHVTAPAGGVVGDIAIREGDRVTVSTMITTIDDKQALEAYIDVPLDRAPDLRTGLPAQLLDSSGRVIATNPITFVASRADPGTQTVLAKSLLRQAPPSISVQQFVRARIVWRATGGLTIPIVSTMRINGQYFCYVAEPSGPGGQLVAHQRPVQVGDIVGNEYVVRGGLKPGDRLIVSGIQKLGDGAPVRAQ